MHELNERLHNYYVPRIVAVTNSAKLFTSYY